LGRVSVSRYSFADPHNRASDHPPSSRSVPGPLLVVSAHAGSPFSRTVRLSRCGRRWLQGCPQKPRQLARDGDGDLGRGLVVFGQASESTTQTLLRPVRDGDHMPGLSLPSARQRLADARSVLIVPGGFHEEPADQRVAGAGDAAPSLMFAALVFARHQAQIRHQRPRRGEPSKIVQFGQDQHRRQRVDPAEAPQPTDRHAIGISLCCLGQSHPGRTISINDLTASLYAPKSLKIL
jgi:hypothetical protein